MGLPRKGWREILVGKRTYHWRAKYNDDDLGVDVVIVTGEALERGKRARRLFFHLGWDDPRKFARTGCGNSPRKHPALTPGVVAFAIEQGLRQADSFAEEEGPDEVYLPESVLSELWARAQPPSEPELGRE